ncbi:double-strand break repair helicase AddA [Alsobacter sp. SYSU M60028]|uniref:DNA 3'-5' helicase n=1 Tax=Alsobacter ponti TaxID=2962936 RepID=A0ABT1LBF9_9HYPH|nr:double-strand break repair helicase AddA [Alsobacter ponti]MCP8938821.1 double-strand break repair helicase AddA [Alsobacter ponti]
MSGGFTIPVATRQAQGRASDPRASAWVSANAGSGKTTVLANRVVRLLLDGVQPGRILSLTFTKAAAANMANRVFDILGSWVSMDDARLSDAIAAIEGERPAPARLAMARRLFARAIETPGGLKIQTIHAFCERLLHLFPFEANVSARFQVLDDGTAAEMLAAAQKHVLTQAALHPTGPIADALAIAGEVAAESTLAALLRDALRLKGWMREQARDAAGIRAAMDALAAELGLAPGQTAADIVGEVVSGGLPPSEWLSVAATLRASGGATEAKLAGFLEAAHAAADDQARHDAYVCAFLTKAGGPRADSSFVTKKVRAAHPALADRMSAERERVHALAELRKAALAVERTHALLTLAEAVIQDNEARKSARGALDFDDLIARTARLLSRADAAWVLYKLDQGIDHILVDEAQDTSEVQWDILRGLAEDFISGESRAGRVRTVFAVGDPKQSIFSFQGAEPRAFERARTHFRRGFDALRRADASRWAFYDEKLTLSFRSAPDVLGAVDEVFKVAAHFRGLSFEEDGPNPVAIGTVHESARRGAPGMVEIWEPEVPAPPRDPEAWSKPVDEPEEGAPFVRLAERIAARIDAWRGRGDEEGRTVRPGDVLVLVRSRGPFFEAMIRALKDRGVPVAGADRLALTQHIAVLDLVALGRSALLPDDDLTLASLLKSPLVGLDDDDLLRFAPGRAGSLSDALARAAATDTRLASAQTLVTEWRALARRAGPFDFYAAVLGPGGGRRRVLARLGAEAGDAVDEFLRLALDYQHRETPSLPRFLAAIEGADIMIRRDMEAGRDEVRVMTVHGAKGLEAPVVFLADTCTVPASRASILQLPLPNGLSAPVWSPSKDSDPPAVTAARQRLADAAREEYHRLLYVGMTRARDLLVVAGFENRKGRGADCWYDMIRRSLEPGCAAATLADGHPVLRWRSAPHPAAPARQATRTETPFQPPAWLETPAPAEPAARPPVRPSSAVEAAEAGGRAGDRPFVREARLVGVLVHGLLESLPALPGPARREAALRLLARRGASLPEARREAIAAQVLALLEDADLGVLFGPQSRAEAPVAGRLPLGPGGAMTPVSGQIDRLAVTEEAVWIADYKTAAVPPADPADVSPAYVGQLAVYRALVQKLYPGRPVRCLLVWTSAPVAAEIAPERLDAALAAIAAAPAGSITPA